MVSSLQTLGTTPFTELASAPGSRTIYFDPTAAVYATYMEEYTGSSRFIPGGGSERDPLVVKDVFQIGQLWVSRYRDASYADNTTGLDGSGNPVNFYFMTLDQEGMPATARREDLEAAFLSISSKGTSSLPEGIPHPRSSEWKGRMNFDLVSEGRGIHEHYGDAATQKIRFHTSDGRETYVRTFFEPSLRDYVGVDLRILASMPFHVAEQVSVIDWWPNDVIGPRGDHMNGGHMRRTFGATDLSFINVYGGMFFDPKGREIRTISHELGHVLVRRNDIRVRNQQVLALALDGPLPLAPYALSHWAEDFSESLMWYVSLGAREFRSFSPHRAALIETILANDGTLPTWEVG